MSISHAPDPDARVLEHPGVTKGVAHQPSRADDHRSLVASRRPAARASVTNERRPPTQRRPSPATKSETGSVPTARVTISRHSRSRHPVTHLGRPARDETMPRRADGLISLDTRVFGGDWLAVEVRYGAADARAGRVHVVTVRQRAGTGMAGTTRSPPSQTQAASTRSADWKQGPTRCPSPTATRSATSSGPPPGHPPISTGSQTRAQKRAKAAVAGDARRYRRTGRYSRVSGSCSISPTARSVFR